MKGLEQSSTGNSSISDGSVNFCKNVVFRERECLYNLNIVVCGSQTSG